MSAHHVGPFAIGCYLEEIEQWEASLFRAFFEESPGLRKSAHEINLVAGHAFELHYERARRIDGLVLRGHGKGVELSDRKFAVAFNFTICDNLLRSSSC